MKLKQFQVIILAAGCLAMFLFSATLLAQQNLTTPRSSQHALVSQRIGLTDITIEYSSPGVKDREIWGKLVPYDAVWRAGANENTTITFTDDVTVEGKQIPAGKYGLHMIPTESNWTVIFSKDNTAWGSFFYDESRDAARVTVTPQTATHAEWLRYGFSDLSANSAVAYLHWGKMMVPVKIEVNVQQVVLANMKNELKSIPGFGWQGWMQIANYCLQNDMYQEEALQWIDKSIGINENGSNLLLKAELLTKSGKTAEADKIAQKGVEVANENDLNTYGYRLLGQDKVKKAIDIFKLNVKRHPDSWNVYDSLGEGYDKNGQKDLALKNYKIALEKAPDNQKSRIEGILKNLGQS